jgi:uncharacterized protein
VLHDLATPISLQERDELEELMAVRDPDRESPIAGSFFRLHGFLTSIVSGPVIVPSEFMPLIFGDDDEGGWETIKQAERAYTLILRLNNEIVAGLIAGEFRIPERRGRKQSGTALLAEWCDGYMVGIEASEGGWPDAFEDPKISYALVPIEACAVADSSGSELLRRPGMGASLRKALPDCAIKIFEWWRERLSPKPVRRSEPKISPNEPCPCGSGKKYKRCCSPMRAV